MSKIEKIIAAVSVTLVGMVALYLKIDYSGWILFAGLVAFWSVL